MAMVRISEQGMKQLKALAAEGNRPLTNQLDELLGVRGMIEQVEPRRAEGDAAKMGDTMDSNALGLFNRPRKPLPKGKSK